MLHCLANVKCIYCTGVMLVYTHFSNWTVQKLAFLCQTNLLASLATVQAYKAEQRRNKKM